MRGAERERARPPRRRQIHVAGVGLVVAAIRELAPEIMIVRASAKDDCECAVSQDHRVHEGAGFDRSEGNKRDFSDESHCETIRLDELLSALGSGT